MDFKNVTQNYRPIPFWSWNEKLNIEETREQIRKMNEAGMGGFFMHARGGLQTEYMSEEWFENVEASADEAEKNGMYAWAYDENGWPSGFGGGKVNGKGLNYQQKYLRYKEGEENHERLIVNKDGFCFYYDVNPYYVDTLDLEVTQTFIKEIYEPYYEKYGNRLEGFFTDEPQISRDGIPWSFKLPAEYKNRYGEDLLDSLIELYQPVGNYKQTRINFWKLITDLFSAHFMKPIYDWCVAHNYQFTGHLVCEETFTSQLTSNGACMPHYEYFTMPGMDWLGRHNIRSLEQHQLKSAARQLGKKQVLSETFACCGHNVGHDELKWIYEYQMVNGITVLCQHLQGYSNRGLRKRDYPPAMYIQQPWWNDYRMFNDAMSRIGMVLTGGDDCVDVLVLHPQTTAWTLYDGVDESVLLEEYNKRYMDLLMRLEAKHINFHLADETLMERYGKVEGNDFVIGEKRYKKFVLPEYEFLFDNTKKLLEEFKANGGIITTEEELEFNDIVDIPQITYCQRKFDDYDVFYFVNSTEGTYDATVKVGNKVLDPVTGDLYDFNGKHTFNKYASLVVIDDRTGRKESLEKRALKPIDLGGEWNIDAVSENSLTLDYCDYYFDGVLEEKNGYILNAMYRAIDKMKKIHITCEYTVEASYKPEVIYLACETPQNFDIKVNGETVDKTDCGYFRDKSFRKLDISKNFKIGENKIVFDIDFEQSAAVYENIEKARVFESEKNKLTFDVELEQIYLVGDFGVDTVGEFKEAERNSSWFSGKFVISEPKNTVCLEKIEQQGFPEFAGEIIVSKKFIIEDTDMMLDFVKTGINVVKAKVNGKNVGTFMWEPYTSDISGYLVKGENEISLTLVNNLRNMQGPFHLGNIGEAYDVGPTEFYKEPCIWTKDGYEDWSDDYSIVNLTVKNRK